MAQNIESKNEVSVRMQKGIRKNPNFTYCKTGKRNEYRMAELKGLLGNYKEKSWDRDKHRHNCCGARQVWRHKVSCKREKNFGRSIDFQRWEDMEE